MIRVRRVDTSMTPRFEPNPRCAELDIAGTRLATAAFYTAAGEKSRNLSVA